MSHFITAFGVDGQPQYGRNNLQAEIRTPRPTESKEWANIEMLAINHPTIGYWVLKAQDGEVIARYENPFADWPDGADILTKSAKERGMMDAYYLRGYEKSNVIVGRNLVCTQLTNHERQEYAQGFNDQVRSGESVRDEHN